MREAPAGIPILGAREDRQETVVVGRQHQDPLVSVKFGEAINCAETLVEVIGELFRGLEERPVIRPWVTAQGVEEMAGTDTPESGVGRQWRWLDRLWDRNVL